MESDSSEDHVKEIPKKILKLKFNVACSTVREVLFCEHKTDNPCPEKPLKRTLFLSKIPPWVTKPALERIFSAANGPISKIFLSNQASSNVTESEQDLDGVARYMFPRKTLFGFQYGYIVFEKPSSMRKALDVMDLNHPYIISTEENTIHTGIKKWKRNHNNRIIPNEDLDELKKSIESFVQEMDEKREDAKSKAEEEAEPDDEGWVKISRNSKKKSTIGAGRSEKVKARLKAREAKKRKNRELRNFYKFQLKETKLKKLSDLREKFEVDKERQRKMIADRKFRPS